MDTSREILGTFAGAVVFGILFNLIAYKLRISSIVVLLFGGILVGPQCFGWIDPEYLGQGLKTIIALAVGLILFEGGLTLDIKGYKLVSREIKGVLTKGVLVTWGVTSIVIKILFSFKWDFSLLAGSLIIVTGPTVIGPILKRIRVKKKLHSILHWEGVLIDPIGVFIALFCYEWIVNPGDQPLIEFLIRCVVGISYGITWGWVISYVVKREWIPEEYLNITFLASAIGIFTLSDMVAHESGLLSVTIAGFVIGYREKQKIAQVKVYKAELIQLLIGLLFVLLTANLDLATFYSFGLSGLFVVLFIMFVVRPLNIFFSTTGSTLSIQEKLFLSWIAPRGVVAASMASLFALNLEERGMEHANFLETFTYSVIVGTVLFQGFTAKWVGSVLGTLEPRPKGWLIIGAHKFGRVVANFIKGHNFTVVLIDLNRRDIALSLREGLTAINENALTINVDDYPEIYGIGNVLAVTENEDLNTLICQRWKREIVGVNLYRWGTHSDSEDQNIDRQLMTGKLIWPNLKLDQFTQLDLDENQLGILIDKKRLEHIADREHILMCMFKQEILPYLPQEETGDCTILSCRSLSLSLDLNIKPRWVKFSNARSLPEVTQELLNLLKNSYSELDIEAVYAQLLDYETKYSGLVCPDTALPHAYADGIEDSIVLIAKLNKSIKSLHGDEPITLVFLILSPLDQPRKHLKTLSEISRFMVDDKNRSKLLHSKSEQHLYNLILSEPVTF